MQEPIIEIKDLVVRFGTRTVLDGINLTIFKGESLAILGKSGCGKSTLLRHIIGLSTPTRGKILIKGKDITTVNEEEKITILKKIGMLFQSSALFNSMTVGDNVALPLREHTELEERIINIMVNMKLESVGLSGFSNLRPAQLSGGMKKRAALARALAMDPEILFCDEPSAGLDPVVAAGIDNLILNLKKAFKMTIVAVTHELASVEIIADRIAMMHDGKILMTGTIDELKESAHPVMRQFFNREPDDEEVDKEKFLTTLTYEG
ncbi:ATP-binding cassette domain-containing protein [candidate division KSB1 bacterium]|nr:ATP-binding cassette domain-containing protein [candidate division KSB1 bacterium]NIR70801.1 ATP-binding cassette domain-containing protein [candidate division KSB1 bacterium]NIS27814.1 ATP-binding cassette domain-containing protein [candidate division KSB1 bacterium]NIT74696.1 ATP-binding cassette domain-containing protein [candidate division KSB1 bacterium]NIU28481.1 ATP-binding cassette domain-containing protein [candidate division KSB1 bacterium]